MRARTNRIVAAAAILAVILATAVVLCGGPSHLMMAGGDAEGGLCALAGHSISPGIADPGDAAFVAAGLMGVVSAGVALATTTPQAASLLPVGSVSACAPSDPLHGRLLI
jgi:hypothetical protein